MNLLLSNKLHKMRVSREIKQEVIAKELGISQQAYSQLERGLVNFTPQLVNKICHFFNIPVMEFLNFGNEIKIINSQAYNNNYNTNSTYESKNTHNEEHLWDDLIQSKEKVIQLQQKLIEKLEQEIQTLKEQHSKN